MSEMLLTGQGDMQGAPFELAIVATAVAHTTYN